MSDYAEPGVITELPAPTPKDLQIGVDIGGTGIKGGIVDLRTGNLVSDRFRIDTPKPATPAAVAEVVRRVVDELQGRDLAPDPESAVGIDFPAVVKNGMVFSIPLNPTVIIDRFPGGNNNFFSYFPSKNLL